VSEADALAVLPWSTAAKDTPAVATFENILRVVFLGVLCGFLFCICSPDNLRDGLSPFSNWQLQDAGVEDVFLFFRTFLVQMTVPAPQTTGWLLAVCPNVANFWQLWHCLRIPQSQLLLVI
jgi:hypothetical protein